MSTPTEDKLIPLTLQLPKPIADFLEKFFVAIDSSLTAYLEDHIKSLFTCDNLCLQDSTLGYHLLNKMQSLLPLLVEKEN